MSRQVLSVVLDNASGVVVLPPINVRIVLRILAALVLVKNVILVLVLVILKVMALIVALVINAQVEFAVVLVVQMVS